MSAQDWTEPVSLAGHVHETGGQWGYIFVTLATDLLPCCRVQDEDSRPLSLV